MRVEQLIRLLLPIALMAIVTTAHAQSVTGLTISPTSVTGGVTATGTVRLTKVAQTGGLQVTLTSNQGAVTVPASVIVPVGKSSTTFTISTTPVASNTVAKITAIGGSKSASANVSVLPPALSSVALSTSTVVGGSSLIGTVKLAEKAPSSGISVTLSSTSKSVSFLTSVQIGGGNTSGSFNISTATVTKLTTAVIKASLNGVQKTVSLAIVSWGAQSITVEPSVMLKAGSSTGTVTLTSVQKTNTVVSLVASNPTVTVPKSLTIKAGLTTGTFTLNGSSTSTGTSTVTATCNGVSQSANVEVLAVNYTTRTIGTNALIPTGISANVVAGRQITQSNYLDYPGVWTGLNTSTFTPLNITGALGGESSGIYQGAMSGSLYLGDASAYTLHACVWPTVNSGPIDLNPAGCPGSSANAISNQAIAGVYTATDGQAHACAWTSASPSSLIDLHSTDFVQTVTTAISGNEVVGFGDSSQYALYWNLNTGKLVNLGSGTANTIFNGQVAGYRSTQNGVHAALWSSPSPDSYLDINPTGYQQSNALGSSAAGIVGHATLSGGEWKAFLWVRNGTLPINLHNYLPSVYSGSTAVAIDDKGNIVGYAHNSTTGATDAVIWTIN